MPECVFCEIVAHRLPAALVAESVGAAAFLTIEPVSEGHTLVVPRSHASMLEDVPELERPDLWELVHRVSERLRAVGLADGVNLLVASGRAAEQGVFHLHVHVVPRRANDGVDMNSWMDAKAHPAVEERQRAIAARLRGDSQP